MLVDQCTTQRRAVRTIVEHIRHPTEPLLCASARVSPHHVVQLARAQFRATAATLNQNEQLSLYKNCVIMAAHNASQ
jgi:hypothetical protein